MASLLAISLGPHQSRPPRAHGGLRVGPEASAPGDPRASLPLASVPLAVGRWTTMPRLAMNPYYALRGTIKPCRVIIGVLLWLIISVY